MAGFEQVCFDASALINLLGSGVPGEILSAAGSRSVATTQVCREVKRYPFDGEQSSGPLIPILEGGFLEVLDLDDAAIDLFLGLVGAKPPDDLDDGEASTIAYGVTRAAVVVIDERKGRRICRERFPQLQILCSLDLFRFYSEVCGDIGKFRGALAGAIKRARMHVPPSYRQWVLDMLGCELSRVGQRE